MRPKTTRKEPIAVRYLHDILVGHTNSGKHSRKAVCPKRKVIFRISYHDALARSTAGCMDTADILQRLGKKPVGVIIAQILFIRERKLG